MSRSFPRLSGLLLAVGLLAGCAGASRLSYVDYTSLYTPEMFQYASGTGEMTTVIRGNPFGPGPGNPEAIAAVFPTPGWSPPRRFTTHPSPGTPRNYRLVLVFNPLSTAPGGDDTCRDPQGEPIADGSASGPIGMQAVFCVGDRWASHLYASGPPAEGPQDPNFRSLLGQTSLLLFPNRRPFMEGDGCRMGPQC